MILRHVYLYLDLNEFPRDVVVPFGFSTRYLCNFVERAIRKLKFQTNGFTKLCVRGSRVPSDSCPLVSDNAVIAPVVFDHGAYQQLLPNEKHEFFASMLENGVEKCAAQHALPATEILKCVEEFKASSFKNHWVFLRKSMRTQRLVAALLCELSMEKFELTLRVERDGRKIYERVILETKPDEIIYEHRFKDLVIENDQLVVRDRFGKSTFAIDLANLDS